jgi:hypothetical protein
LSPYLSSPILDHQPVSFYIFVENDKHVIPMKIRLLKHPVNKLILVILLLLALLIGAWLYYNRRIDEIEYKLKQTSGLDYNSSKPGFQAGLQRHKLKAK